MFDHILLPIAPDHNPFQQKAMSVAQTLLNDGGKINVMNVAEIIPHYAAAQIPDALMHQNVEASQELVAKAAAKHDNCEGVSVQGHPANAILDYGESNGVDCIVIASHRPGLADYLLGSTAARVVRHATCHVHVVR